MINGTLLSLICIYFINDEVGHLFKSLLSICIYSVSLCIAILRLFSYIYVYIYIIDLHKIFMCYGSLSFVSLFLLPYSDSKNSA